MVRGRVRVRVRVRARAREYSTFFFFCGLTKYDEHLRFCIALMDVS